MTNELPLALIAYQQRDGFDLRTLPQKLSRPLHSDSSQIRTKRYTDGPFERVTHIALRAPDSFRDIIRGQGLVVVQFDELHDVSRQGGSFPAGGSVVNAAVTVTRFHDRDTSVVTLTKDVESIGEDV